MLEALQRLDEIRLNFSQESLLALNITLAFIMFGVALEIRVENFRELWRKPKIALIGIGSQFILLPALTFLVTFLFRSYITPGVALGMILVAACPGGNISNFISSLAKGNIALSVTLTAFATLAAMVMTPLNFNFWGELYVHNFADGSSELVRDLQIPFIEVFKTIFILLGIPLMIGMWFRWKFPKITARISKPIKLASIFIFMAMVVLAFIKNSEYFLDHIKWIFIIVLFHNALALTTGYSIASIFKLSKQNRKTISIETGIQNSGLALVLLFNTAIFPEDLPIGGLAFIAAWWGIWHILAGMGIAFIWSKGKLDSNIEVEASK
jgi:BASS family bile acid:Na+ symporter